jgi:ring-1,2-phenylacetyl-CoA epoxidase subunit PaaE
MSTETDEIVETDSGFVPLTVASVEPDTEVAGSIESVVIEFDTTDDARFRFEHGQHLTLRREFDGVELRRSYSICSGAPDGSLRVAVRLVPGGVFSTWATSELRAGDTVEVLPPAGHFSHELEATATRTYTLLAAGSGITPVISIMSTILRHEPNSTVTLLYINRTSTQTMLLDDLHDLRDRYLGRVTINFAFTREESGGELLSGRPDRRRLDALIATGLLPADADHVFLCGPIDLIAQAQDALVAAGTPPARIHREIFTTNQPGRVTAAPQVITETSVAVCHGRATLHGRTSTFEVYEGDSVLDAVQRVRPDAPFSCRSGVCSTCQAVVGQGAVTMDVNYGLSDDEVARGYVLTCQSRPTTDALTVDYDA